MEILVLTTYTIEPSKPAKTCVIWLHGLGANGENMRGVVEALPEINMAIRHVLVDAPIRPVTVNNRIPMRAWYDLTGFTLEDRDDREGILESESALSEIITAQMQQGFQAQRIYLGGFSQGGAMALFTAMRTQYPLGGVLALSSYLPLQQECVASTNQSLPIFIAAGLSDQVVVPIWTKSSYEFVKKQGFSDIEYKEYPMEHTICIEEIRDVARWLQTQMQPVQGEN